MLVSSSGIFTLIIGKASWGKTWLKVWKVWRSSYLFVSGEVASKPSGPLDDTEVWRHNVPRLGGSWERCHTCHSGDHLVDVTTNSCSSPQRPGFQCKFSRGEAWLESLRWIGLFVNSKRQSWRAIKNSNYVNRPEKNDCLQKSVAITRHNGSQLGWRGFSVIHNSLS